MSLQASLSNYEKYLKYRRPEGFEFSYSGDKTYVWILEKTDNYTIGSITAETDQTVTVSTPEGHEHIVSKEQAEHLKVNPPKFDGVEDCSTIPYLSDASVLHNLRLRYDADIVYTYSGLFLVALNPYKHIPIYTQEMINLYMGKRRADMAPHIFSSAETAYRYMLEQQKNQAMLITGESGAGKTENTKKVIQYLTTIAGHAGSLGQLENQLLKANPLLEAIGNAKTLKNNNSSRFGKFIKITFDKGGYISGASIVSYLLERSRVVCQAPGERSFHIFYQICTGLTPEQKQKWFIGPPESYKFLSGSGCVDVKHVDDAKEFGYTLEAMRILGFDEDEIETLIKVIVGVLQLGNLEFLPENSGESSRIGNPEVLNRACELLDVPVDILEDGLLRPRIKAGRDLVSTVLTPEKAANSRDALCKVLYGRMFLWVVQKINQTLHVKPTHLSIGILDIAGFEIFKHNSFEQICINYTNERLQQFFNNHMFTLEQEEYTREKLDWEMINFGIDSQITIDLIEKKPKGILALLDEESVFPSATDLTFIAKLNAAHDGKHPKYRKSKLGSSDLTFTVVHYAGDVEYNASMWLEKNKDPLHHDLEACFKDSKNPVIAAFVTQYSIDASKTEDVVATGRSSSRKKGSAFITVGSQYKEQLLELIDILEATHPHFIRCILPNREQTPGTVEAPIVLDQLRCNGILEGIRISRKGFPNRLVYSEFLKRYHLLAPGMSKKVADPRMVVQSLIETLVNKQLITDPDEYRMGTTKIFFRTGVIGRIEKAREQQIAGFIPVIQAASRAYLSRKYFSVLHQRKLALEIIQRNVHAWFEFKNWPWFKLYTKARPLLKRRNFEKEMEEHLEKIQKLELTNKEGEQKCQLIETSLNALKAEHDRVKGRLEELEAVKERLGGENAENDRMRKILESKVEELKAMIEDRDMLLEESDLTQENLSSKLHELEKELDDEIAKADQLALDKKKNLIELEGLHAQLDTVQEELSLVKRNNQQLEQDLMNSVNDRDGEQNAKEQLLRLRKKLQDELESITEEYQGVKHEKQELQKKLTKADQTVKELRNTLELEGESRVSIEGQWKACQKDLKDLSEELDKRDRMVKLLEKGKKQLEQDLEQLQVQMEEDSKSYHDSLKVRMREEELSTLQEELSNEMSERERLSALSAKLEKEIAMLREQLEKALAQIARLEKLKAQLESTVAELTSKLEEEERKVAKLLKDKRDLESELEGMTAQLEQQTRQQAVLEKAKRKAETEGKALRQELEGEKATRGNVERDLKKAQHEVNTLNQELEQLEKAKAVSERTKREQELASGGMEGELRELHEEKALCERKLNQLESDVEELEEQLDELRDERDNLASEKVKSECRLEELQHALDRESDANVKLEGMVKRLDSELQEVKGELESEGKRASQLQKIQKKAHADTEELVQQIANLEKSLSNSEKQKKKMSLEVKDAKKTSTELQSMLDMANNDLSTMKARLEEMQYQSEKLGDRAMALEQARNQLEVQLRIAEEEAYNAEAARKKLQCVVKELEGELSAASDASMVEHEVQTLKNCIAKQQSELEQQRALTEKQSQMREHAEEERSSAQRELEQLKVRMSEETKKSGKREREYGLLRAAHEEALKGAEEQKTLNKKLAKKVEHLEREKERNATMVSSSELQGLKSELNALRSELERERGQRMSAERRSESSLAQVVTLNTALQEVEEGKLMSDSQRQRLENDVRRIGEQLEEQEQTVSELRERLSAKELECANSCRGLETESEARAKYESLHAALSRDHIEVKNRLEEQTKAKGEAESRMRQVELNLEHWKTQAYASESDYAALKKERKRLLEECRKLSEHADNLKLEKSEKEHLAWKFQQELDALNAQYDQEHRVRLQAQKDAQMLELQLSDGREALDQHHRQKAQYTKQMNDLRQELSEEKSSNQSLLSRLSSLEQERSQLQNSLANAAQALNREVENRGISEEAKLALERELVQIRDRHDRACQALDTAERARRTAESELAALNDRVGGMSIELSKSEKAFSSMETELGAMRRKLAEAQSQSSQHQAELSHAEKELHRLKARLQESEDVAMHASVNHRAMEDQVSRLKEELRVKDEHLEVAKADLDKEKSKLLAFQEHARTMSSFFK